jgi:hypothetical protein
METQVSLKEYVDQRFLDQETAVKAALTSAEKAVKISEDNNQNWRSNANEWRGAMSDRERDFLTRKEFYAIVGTAVSIITLVLLFTKLFK